MGALKPHPRNYRKHPDDQQEHLRRSLRDHGLYRNVITARDGTILAGHGVVEAAQAEGLEQVPVVRLDVEPDDPRALKVLTGDNELARLAEVNDRELAELLRQISEVDAVGLLGTGWDEAMLANLVYVTRPAAEIGDQDDAAAWAGLPDFEAPPQAVQCLVSFDTEADRDAFIKHLGIEAVYHRERGPWSVWWPPRDRELDVAFRFQEEEAPA